MLSAACIAMSGETFVGSINIEKLNVYGSSLNYNKKHENLGPLPLQNNWCSFSPMSFK